MAAPRASLRESFSPPAVETTDRLNAVAHGDLDIAVVIFQLVDVDLRLALAADIDERRLPRRSSTIGAFDGLTLLDALRFR